MPVTDSEMIAALAKRAGWESIGTDIHVEYHDEDDSILCPLQHHDDAFALQEWLCEDAEFMWRFSGQLLAHVAHLSNPRQVVLALASLSPADRTRLLYAAHVAGQERG